MKLRCCGAWRFGTRIQMVMGLSFTLATACGGSVPASRNSATAAGALRETRNVHEECDVRKATDRIDVNSDGVAEVSRVRKGERLECEVFDLNQDGSADLWVYYDGAGQIRRREITYERGAQVTEIRHYTAGKLTAIDQTTLRLGRLDTWHFFQGGRRARTERDSDGDGRVDEWWEYPNPAKPDCPLMFQDQNNDGQPEKTDGVDLCAAGYVPPERKVFRATSPKFERDQGGVPTEVEKRDDDAVPGDPLPATSKSGDAGSGDVGAKGAAGNSPKGASNANKK